MPLATQDFQSQRNPITTDTPAENNELPLCRLMGLPPEIREMILKHIFQDHIDFIGTIPFPRPAAGNLFQPRFNKSYNVVLCRRVLAILHTNQVLRLESFDVYMPLSTGFWQSVMAEIRELREDRQQRGDSAVLGDCAAMQRRHLNSLRAERAMHIFQALREVEANST
jgi:hypothetical protein